MAAGELYRSKEEAQRLALAGLGIKQSLHQDRLAFDLILKQRIGDGWRLLDAGHPAWAELGRWWMARRAVNAWGGDFRSRDMGHFSSSRGGRR
jgi:hypothetical protein